MITNSSRLWAIMPVKNVDQAKQRLAPVLSPNERRGLFLAMVEDVLAVLAGCAGLAGVLVVTRSPEAKALARRHGARLLIEPANQGHTAASRLGAATLAKEGAAGMLQIPGDLPTITSADIDALLATHDDAPSVTIAPSRDELGSNALACSPPDFLPLRFGDDSFFPHVDSAKALGVQPMIVKRPALGLDIDTPDDLRTLLETPLATGVATRARAYLRETGIDKHLGSMV